MARLSDDNLLRQGLKPDDRIPIYDGTLNGPSEQDNVATSFAKNLLQGSPFANDHADESWLKLGLFRLKEVTDTDANGLIMQADVVWSDGVEGLYTTTEVDPDHHEVNAYEVTHPGDTITRKLVQNAVTRDQYGNVSQQPEPLIVVVP